MTSRNKEIVAGVVYAAGSFMISIITLVTIGIPAKALFEDNNDFVKAWLIYTIVSCLYLYVFLPISIQSEASVLVRINLLVFVNTLQFIACGMLYNFEMGRWATITYRIMFIPSMLLAFYYIDVAKNINKED